jgi:hypothetical protein
MRVSIGVWFTHRCYLLENGSLHRSRLSPPARWDAPLSSRKASSPPGTASRGRWKSARGVCGQHSRLPPLPEACALSMEWQCDCEASPGECAAACAPGRSRTIALAGLESQRPPTRLSAAHATATHRGEPIASRRFATHRGRDPLPCAARALAPLLGRAVGSQCASSNRRSRHDQADRASQKALLPRSGWRRLNPALPGHRISYSSDTFAAPSGTSWPFSLAVPQLLPVWLPIPLILPSLAGSTSSSEQLSLLTRD